MPELQPGLEIGKHRLERLLGQGGMGQVWLANHTVLNMNRAIKFLLPGHYLLEDTVKRFMREARILAALDDCPNIVGIHDIEDSDYGPYIVMDYVPNNLGHRLGESQGADTGQTIASVSRGQCLPIDEALFLIQQICEALIAAHAKGVIHRDLKPANVLLTTDGVVKVCDFGIAFDETGSRLTATGMGMGSMGYTAPEVIHGGASQADVRSDVYSVGALLYHMVTGQIPVGRFKDPIDVNADIGDALNDVILCCLEQDPQERYDSVQDILNDLSDLEDWDGDDWVEDYDEDWDAGEDDEEGNIENARVSSKTSWGQRFIGWFRGQENPTEDASQQRRRMPRDRPNRPIRDTGTSKRIRKDDQAQERPVQSPPIMTPVSATSATRLVWERVYPSSFNLRLTNPEAFDSDQFLNLLAVFERDAGQPNKRMMAEFRAFAKDPAQGKLTCSRSNRTGYGALNRWCHTRGTRFLSGINGACDVWHFLFGERPPSQIVDVDDKGQAALNEEAWEKWYVKVSRT